MGAAQPFQYENPSRYSFTGPTQQGFNPKRVSQASWAPQAPRPKPEGPLINAKEFNRHPDSYFIVPYGNLDWKPMSPRTKSKVKYTRFVQLFLRILALLGALGMLVCVIFIKGTSSSLGWIIRIPPGVAILHTIYAIYHLARSSKGRTPASSGSYMLFAAIIDAGLIPFFVFTAIMSRAQYTEPSSTPGAWQTLFNDDSDNYKIIFSAFLFSVVNGSIHLLSLGLSIYLGIIFRKISKLPPDLNPLEDNLTSRHKRNKSSISTVPTDTNKRDSYLSAPLIDPPRTVPFLYTRADSATNLSTTNLSSPHRRPASSNRSSRTDLPSPNYHQASHYSSRVDLSLPPSPTKHTSFPPSSRPTSTRPSSTRPQSAHPSLTNDNWFAYPSPTSSPSPPPPPPKPYPQHPPELRHLRITNLSSLLPNPLVPKPLQMNPPTPSPAPTNFSHRTLTPASGNSVHYNSRGYYEEESRGNPYYEDENSSQGLPTQAQAEGRKERPESGGRQDSFGVAGGKGRFYGELYGATGKGKGERVISSGREVERGMGLGIGGGGVRGRAVSGKVIEEGRGTGVGMGF